MIVIMVIMKIQDIINDYVPVVMLFLTLIQNKKDKIYFFLNLPYMSSSKQTQNPKYFKCQFEQGKAAKCSLRQDHKNTQSKTNMKKR